MRPPKQTHQPPPPRDETQWLSTLPRKLCSKRKLGNSHLLLHNQNSAFCSSSWLPSSFSPGRTSLMAQDFNKGAAFTRHSGTHHQQLEITPTLNKKGSDVPTWKFSWISSRRASPRPCSSLGNIGEAVPLGVYPQEHRPPTATPLCRTRTGSSWGSHVTESALHRSWVQVLQTRLLPSAGEDLTATEDWKPERSSVRSTVSNTEWTEVKMAGNSEKFPRQPPNIPPG